MIYETKNMTLEQVDELYTRVSKAWKSPGFVPSVSFTDIRAGEKGQRRESIVEAAERKASVSTQEAVRS